MAICDTYLEDIDTAFSEANYQYHTFLVPITEWFQDEVFTHVIFDSDWRQKVSSMCTTIDYILKFLIHGNWQGNHPYRLPYYLRYCIDDGMDMDMLLSAMVTADFSQLQYFIGIVDAYRQSLWNKPFNAEFFAALARGFE